MSAVGESVEPLWRPTPEAIERAAITKLTRQIEADHGVELPDYGALWQWSVDHLDEFWTALWSFAGIRGEGAREPVLVSEGMPGARWFPNVRLNFADQVFADRDPDAVALVQVIEDGASLEITWAELERQVAALAATYRRLGVGEGDRVVGYLPNVAATVVAFLAAASIGAIWSVCAPDYAAEAASARLAQLDPALLVSADGYRFNGTHHDRRAEALGLAEQMPNLKGVVYLPYLGLPAPAFGVPVTSWDAATADAEAPLTPVPLAFEHPLWVLYSSGTTGVPKGLVHSHGGVVLESKKVLRLHFDLEPGDRLFWYTSPNWMMWNFAISALVVGASTVTYDGSPSYRTRDHLWQVCAEHGVTVFGASPAYLQACERGGDKPAASYDLSALRLIGVTGSPVAAATFHWIHEQFEGTVPLMSTSGGTDIVSALAVGTPTVPIWPGEISGPALAVALDAFDTNGRPVRGQVGELVVTKPMPTMPLFLWNDPEGERYRDAYFGVFPGIWRHGDWITLTERGSVTIHGRSDATLNRKGVRIGSADIYAIVDMVPGVKEALVVGIDLPDADYPDADYWMPLFVVLEDGIALDDALREEIANRLRQQASPRHVPDEIIAVPAIPHTRTGKKLEVPIKRILNGSRPEDVLSLGAVEDPTALDAFVALGQQRQSR